MERMCLGILLYGCNFLFYHSGGESLFYVNEMVCFMVENVFFMDEMVCFMDEKYKFMDENLQCRVNQELVRESRQGLS